MKYRTFQGGELCTLVNYIHAKWSK